MQIQQLPADEALARLGSTAQGLTAELARSRLLEYGPNRVAPRPRQHWLLRLLKEFTQLFSVILWVAAGLAFLAQAVDPGQDMARVGVAVVAVILVSGVFSFWQEVRVEHTLAALQRMLPQQVLVLRDGVARMVDVQFLVPGDMVVLNQGDNVPADCRLIEAFGVRVNRSTITGESLPQSCNAEPSTESRPAASRNIVLAGTALVAGRGRALVFATGRNTEFGRIAQLTQEGDAGESPLRREVAHLSRTIAMLALGMGALLLAIGIYKGWPLWRDVLLALGITIAMVPEGLLPTLTLALVLAARRLMRRQVLIRHLPSVETLGSVTVICTDKTGTLTENSMRADAVFLDLQTVPLEALAQQPQQVERNRLFFQVARDCQNLTETRKGDRPALDGDPLEIALVRLAQRFGTRPLNLPRCDEWPFDSERMRQAVALRSAASAQDLLLCKGALQTVLPLCTAYTYQGQCLALTPTICRAVEQAQEAMADRGLRVIALAARHLPPGCGHEACEEQLVLCGLVGIADPPRPEVKDAIAACHGAGIRVIMVTGDHLKTATALARQIGLVRSDLARVITGEQLQALSAAELQTALEAPELIFARVAADQKLRIVQSLQAKGHIVAATGDGVNDAPALRAAHIGISMGKGGTDVAREASDMVLLDDNFASIVAGIEEGRAIFLSIRKFLTYVLVHNTAELLPTLAYALLGIPLPLTAVQALAVDMGTDSLTALSLGVEAGNPNNMRRPPRARSERLFNAVLAVRAYLFLGLVEAAAVLAVFVHTLQAGGWRYGTDLAASDALYRQATTASLAAIVLLQMVNVLLCRSTVRPAYREGFGANPLLLWGLAVELALILLIAYTPWGNALLGTQPLPWDTWLYLLPWAVAMVVVDTLWKVLARHTLARRLVRQAGHAAKARPA